MAKIISRTKYSLFIAARSKLCKLRFLWAIVPDKAVYCNVCFCNLVYIFSWNIYFKIARLTIALCSSPDISIFVYLFVADILDLVERCKLLYKLSAKLRRLIKRFSPYFQTVFRVASFRIQFTFFYIISFTNRCCEKKIDENVEFIRFISKFQCLMTIIWSDTILVIILVI